MTPNQWFDRIKERADRDGVPLVLPDDILRDFCSILTPDDGEPAVWESVCILQGTTCPTDEPAIRGQVT
jgi:hypothetical protein